MADFDPFESGAIALDEPQRQADFDPFAAGAIEDSGAPPFFSRPPESQFDPRTTEGRAQQAFQTQAPPFDPESWSPEALRKFRMDVLPTTAAEEEGASKDRASSAAASFMAGGGVGTGQTVSALARLADMLSASQLAEASGRTGLVNPKESGELLAEAQRRISRTPEEREREIAADPVTKFGQELAAGAKEAFPENPKFKGEFFASTIPSSAGQMVPTIAAGMVNPVLAAGQYGLSAGQAGAEESIAAGDLEDADKVFLAYLGLGAISEFALGVPANVVRYLRAARAGGVDKTAARETIQRLMLKGGAREAGQETLEQTGQNLVAQQTFDPNRKIGAGVPESAAAGFLLGGAVAGGAAATGAAGEALADRMEERDYLRRSEIAADAIARDVARPAQIDWQGESPRPRPSTESPQIGVPLTRPPSVMQFFTPTETRNEPAPVNEPVPIEPGEIGEIPEVSRPIEHNGTRYEKRGVIWYAQDGQEWRPVFRAGEVSRRLIANLEAKLKAPSAEPRAATAAEPSTNTPVSEGQVPPSPVKLGGSEADLPAQQREQSRRNNEAQAAQMRAELEAMGVTMPEKPTATALDPSQIPTVEVPVADIKLSKDVPNFKGEASETTGVVPGQELAGRYERRGTAPVVIWRRSNGDLEIITGRHRLDLARRNNEKTIPAQIVDEVSGFTKAMALTFDAEANIRDGQGSIKDYAHYFKLTPDLTQPEAVSRGLLSRVKGKTGWLLARSATDDLYSLWLADKLTDEQATAIVKAAPGDVALQRVGVKQAAKGRTADQLANDINAAKVLTSTVPADQMDMFGSNDAAIQQMERMSDIARSKQRNIQDDIRAISGASKNPERARALGVDVKDPASVEAKLRELWAEKYRWDDWSKDSELIRQIRAEAEPKPTPSKLPRRNDGRLQISELNDSQLSELSKAVGYDEKSYSGLGNQHVRQSLVNRLQDLENKGLLDSGVIGGPASLAKSTLELDKPESVAEQNARLAQEAVAKKAQEVKDKLATEAAARLKGTAGDLGQGDLLGEPTDLFAPPAPKPAAPTPTAEKPFGSENKIVSTERADALRQRIKDKLKRTNIGVDPTIFSDAVQLGAYYIEGGYHKFVDWSAKMLEDFGDAIKDHLKSIYETAKITIESPGGESVAGRAAGIQPGLRPPAERIVTARDEFTKTADERILPGELLQFLDAHQRQGAATALKSLTDRGAFLLADGTGAGKTRQAITVAHHYAEQGRKVIIVTKSETIKQDWKKNTFGGSYAFDSNAMGVKIKLARDGVVQPGEIGITTYQNLAAVERASDKNTVIIYDESHSLKNDSQQAKFGNRAAAKADKVMFMSATPADKPEHIYYLAPIGVMEGKTIQQALRDLGMTLVTVNKMVKEGNQWVKRQVTFWAEDQNVTDAERHERFSALFDRMTANGAALKREISMDGVHVQVLRLVLPPEAHETMGSILSFFDANTIDDLQGLKKATVLGHQRRQQEPFKIAPTVMLAKRELDAGRQVVIFVSRVNESEVGKWVTQVGPGGERERFRTVLMSTEGTVKTLAEALHEAGIHDIAEIHGNADQNSLEAMADFQAGRKRVVIATIESGGTGINLDDTAGNRPRSMIVVTAPFDAVGNVQAAGRIWRLKTLSGSSVYYLFGDTDVDQWNADIIGTKMSMLGAVVEGQVRRLNMSDPELVGTDDFHSTVRREAKPDQPATAPTEVPTLDWKPFKTKAGKDRFVAPATKEFWDWYNANGKGDNPLGLKPSKYQDKWQVWADEMPQVTELASQPQPLVDQAIAKIEDLQKRIRGSGSDVSMGVPKAILDLALEAARLTLKAGKSVAEAIDAAIAKIRESIATFTEADEAVVRSTLEWELTQEPVSNERLQHEEEPRAKVAGIPEIGQIRPVEHLPEILNAVREKVIDARKPLSETLDLAWSIARELTEPSLAVRAGHALKYHHTIGSADAGLVTLKQEIMLVGLKQAFAGDDSLLRYTFDNSADFQTTVGGGATSVGRALRGEQGEFYSALYKSLRDIFGDQKLSNAEIASGLDRETFFDLISKLKDLNLSAEDIQKIIETGRNSQGESVADMMQEPLLEALVNVARQWMVQEGRTLTLTGDLPAEVNLKKRIMAMFPTADYRKFYTEKGADNFVQNFFQLLMGGERDLEGNIWTADRLLMGELRRIMAEKAKALGFEVKPNEKLTLYEKVAQVLGKGELRRNKIEHIDGLIRDEIQKVRDNAGESEAAQEAAELHAKMLEDAWDEIVGTLGKAPTSDTMLNRIIADQFKKADVKWSDVLANPELKRQIVDAALAEIEAASSHRAVDAAHSPLDLATMRTALDTRFERLADIQRAKEEANRKAAEERRAKALADLPERTAKRWVDEFEKLDTEWIKPENKNAVLEIIRAFLKSKPTIIDYPTAEDIAPLRDQFVAAGVTESSAENLARAVHDKARRQWADANSRIMERASESGNIRSLVEAVIADPYRAQNSPEWLRKTAVNWFMSNGLTPERAEAAYRLFEPQFRKALADAQEKVARQVLESKRKDPRTIKELVTLIRSGVLDPSRNWLDELAERRGWKKPTAEQYGKLEELDDRLAQPDLSPLERRDIVEQQHRIIRHLGKLDGQMARTVAESFLASLLTGFRTFTVQFTAAVAGLRDVAIGAAFNPTNTFQLMRAMKNAVVNNFKSQLNYTWQKGISAFHVNEVEQNFSQLERLHEDVMAAFKKGTLAQKAAAASKYLFAQQRWVLRLLNAMDSASAAVTREYKLAYYSSLAFKEAGLDTRMISELLDAQQQFRQAEYEKWINARLDHDRAHLRANATVDSTTREFLTNKGVDGRLIDAVFKSAENDSYSVVGRLAPGVQETGKGVSEGLLSKPMNAIVKFVGEQKAKGGWSTIAAQTMFGFVAIPWRSTKFASTFMWYGLVRAGIDSYRTKRGLPTFWKQSYGTVLQSRARLREAIAGTVVGVAAGLLLANTADDDPEDDEFRVYVTGSGPTNKNLKDAWIKRGFQQYAINFKINGRIRMIPLTRIGEFIMYPFIISAAIDDAKWKQKERALTGKPPANPISLYAATLVGEHLSMMGQRGLLQTAGQLNQSIQQSGSFGKGIARLAAGTAAGIAIPFKQLLSSISEMFVGPLDNSSASSIVANSLPIVGLPFQNPAVNRFGDQMYDRSWYGRIARTGVPFAFQVDRAPENQRLYTLLVNNGVAPPELRRGNLENKYGPLTDDQFADFAKKSGALLKQSTVSNLSNLQRATPAEVKSFLSKSATQADKTAAAALGLQQVEKPETASSEAGPSLRAATSTATGGIAALPPIRRASTGRLRASLSRRIRTPALGRVRSRIGRTRFATMRVPRLRRSRLRASLSRPRVGRFSVRSRMRRRRVSYV